MLQVPIQRFLFRQPMHSEMIVFVDPLPQPLIQLLECDSVGQSSEKLHPDGFYPAFDLLCEVTVPFLFGSNRGKMVE